MTAKRILAAWGLALALAMPAAAGAALKVETVEVKEQKPTYAIAVAYPKTSDPRIDRVLEAWAGEAEREFWDLAKEADGSSPGPWALDISYEIPRNDGAMFAVMFAHYSYTGGAHGNTYAQTFSFLMPDAIDVELPELVTPRGIAKISDIAIQELSRKLGGPDGMSDVDWIKRGAGPNARNFRSFVLQPSSLTVYFDAYQVAAYAAGPQEVSIPLSQLQGLMRSDPRAPVASFDCARARSDVEQAICSSRDLARLDRHVSEAYAERLSWADDEAKRGALRDEQRAWLKGRDAACLRVAQPFALCLMGVYRERLRVLERGV